MERRLALAVRQLTLTATMLPSLRTAEDVECAAAHLLRSLIDCDEVLLTEVDLAGAGTVVRTGAGLARDTSYEQDLAPVAHQHPAVLSYLRPGDDRRPRRLSDVATGTSWRRSPVFNEVFRERGGFFQLSLVTSLGGTTGVGWVLTRASQDFSDADVEVASLALAPLTAMGVLAAALPAGCRVEVGLTPREEAVLQLLARGLSATAMSHALGISESTVRKHLEHIYAKLSVQDRLSAVLAATRLGYVEPQHGSTLFRVGQPLAPPGGPTLE